MWDEKQFFEDFVKESDKIKPNRDFVKSLEALVKEENSRKITPIGKNYRALASAAVVLLFVSVAGAYFLTNGGGQTADIGDSGLYADHAEETGEDSLISGGQFESNTSDMPDFNILEDCISLSDFEEKGYEVICDSGKDFYSLSITNNSGTDKAVTVVAVYKKGDEIKATKEKTVDITDGNAETVIFEGEEKDFEFVEFVFAEDIFR